MRSRIVEPEWLDQLPPDDPRAIASRSDLRRINRLMGHVSTISRLFLKYAEPQTGQRRRLRIADLGGGDGTFLLRLARKWSARGIFAEADILDARSAVSPETADAFCGLNWSVQVKTVDALHWARQAIHPPDSRNEAGSDDPCGQPCYDLILCNLFLHHFKDAELPGLLAGIARNTKLFIACEPRRSPIGLWGVRAFRLIRCSAVTLHDARASVQAGFAGDELSRLWPCSRSSGWHSTEGAQWWSHYFVAKRQ